MKLRDCLGPRKKLVLVAASESARKAMAKQEKEAVKAATTPIRPTQSIQSGSNWQNIKVVDDQNSAKRPTAKAPAKSLTMAEKFDKEVALVEDCEVQVFLTNKCHKLHKLHNY
jgi:hypothetical protein